MHVRACSGKGALFPCSARQPKPGKAVLAMWEAISATYRDQGAKVRLVTCGALTNAALLLTLFPEVIGMIDITLMGGAMGCGNTGPVAEFNIQGDPVGGVAPARPGYLASCAL